MSIGYYFLQNMSSKLEKKGFSYLLLLLPHDVLTVRHKGASFAKALSRSLPDLFGLSHLVFSMCLSAFPHSTCA